VSISRRQFIGARLDPRTHVGHQCTRRRVRHLCKCEVHRRPNYHCEVHRIRPRRSYLGGARRRSTGGDPETASSAGRVMTPSPWDFDLFAWVSAQGGWPNSDK
jgi:hypothetical protein